METLHGIPITDDIRQVLRLADMNKPDMTPTERAEWEREFAKLKTHSFEEVLAHCGLTEADLEKTDHFQEVLTVGKTRVGILMDRCPKWVWRLIIAVCRLSPGYRWLDDYLTTRGYHRTWDGRWENHQYEVLPAPLWNPGAFHVYQLGPNGDHVGWTLFEGIDQLEDGIGLTDGPQDELEVWG